MMEIDPDRRVELWTARHDEFDHCRFGTKRETTGVIALLHQIVFDDLAILTQIVGARRNA